MSALRSSSPLPLPLPVVAEPLSLRRRISTSLSRRIHVLATLRRANTSSTPAASSKSGTLRATGDMTDWGAVQSFASRATARLQAPSHGRGPFLIDLSAVTSADTKLIACLVCLTASARHARRAVEFRFSSPVRDWIALCGLEPVLGGPSVAPGPAGAHRPSAHHAASR